MKPGSDAEIPRYLEVLRRLVPQSRRIDLFGSDGRFIAGSADGELAGLRPLVSRLLDKAGLQGRSVAGLQRVVRGRAVHLLVVHDGDGGVRGVVSILGRRLREGEQITPLAAVQEAAGPALPLLGQFLAQRGLLDTIERRAAETVELRALLDFEQIQAQSAVGGDAVRATLGAVAERLECDAALLLVPGPGLGLVEARGPDVLGNAAALLDLARGHLFEMVASRAQTLVLNRLRDAAGGELLPHRVLCLPLWHRHAVHGLLAAFRRQELAPFEDSHARLLEQLRQRVTELVANTYDENTGLLTRQAFEDQARDRVSRSPDGPRCVIYGNLDRLHAVNDLFGFARGDELLRRVAQLWRESPLADGSIVCRLSGDRFVALLEGTSLERACAWAERLRAAIASMPPPPECAGLQVTASLGVAPLPAWQTLNHALAAAESACKAAKDRGRNRVDVFADADVSLMRRHDDLRVFRHLVEALDAERLRLYAQPIRPLADATRPVEYEILVRLLDESGRLVMPDEFLSAATRYQLLGRLDQWVLRAAIERLTRAGESVAAAGARFWINVSGQSIGRREYAELAVSLLRQSSLPVGSVGFEITENAAIASLDAAKRCIDDLRVAGCAFALDDFGTGLSSLAYLKELRVSKLKIAGSFIRDLRGDPRAESLLRAMLVAAEPLGLETVAECVEEPQTVARLAALGVTYGQGYALGRPQPIETVLASLRPLPVEAPAPPGAALERRRATGTG
ncbi:MAG: EAL domain-containing protein [Proteobacteria bacterium]|nr:EAL domain-containing protein [Pseudomonadota bacterium]